MDSFITLSWKTVYFIFNGKDFIEYYEGYLKDSKIANLPEGYKSIADMLEVRISSDKRIIEKDLRNILNFSSSFSEEFFNIENILGDNVFDFFKKHQEVIRETLGPKVYGTSLDRLKYPGSKGEYLSLKKKESEKFEIKKISFRGLIRFFVEIKISETVQNVIVPPPNDSGLATKVLDDFLKEEKAKNPKRIISFRGNGKRIIIDLEKDWKIPDNFFPGSQPLLTNLTRKKTMKIKNLLRLEESIETFLLILKGDE